MTEVFIPHTIKSSIKKVELEGLCGFPSNRGYYFHDNEFCSCIQCCSSILFLVKKTGVTNNSERIVNLCLACRSPLGEARPDKKILAKVDRLGFSKQLIFNNSAEVYGEFVKFLGSALG